MDYSPLGSSIHGDSPGKNTRVGCYALLQGIFLTQESNQGLLNCRQILYQLSHRGRARILEWVAVPFSRGSFQPRNQTRVSWIASGFFTNWATKQNELDHINKIHRQSFKINTERLTVVFMAFSSFFNFPPLALTYKVTGESIPTKSVSNAFSFLTWRTKLWWEMAFSTLLYWDFPGCPALKI